MTRKYAVVSEVVAVQVDAAPAKRVTGQRGFGGGQLRCCLAGFVGAR